MIYEPHVRYEISGTVEARAENAGEGITFRPRFELRIPWVAGPDEPEEAVRLLQELRKEFPNSTLGLTKFTEQGESIYVPKETT